MSLFSRWFSGLRGKFLAIAILPIIGFSITTAISLNSSYQLGSLLDDTYADLIPAVDTFHSILNTRDSFGYYTYAVLMNSELAEARAYYVAKVKDTVKLHHDLVAILDKKDKTPEEVARMEKLNVLRKEYEKLNDEIVAYLEKNTKEDNNYVAGLIKKDGPWHKTATAFKYAVKAEIDLNKQQTVEGSKKEKELRAQTKNLLLATGASCALLIFCMLMLIANKITKSVQQIAGQLTHAGAQVNEAIQQLSISGQSLSQSSTESAASLEETVASLEEMSSMVKMNSDNAKQAASLSQSSKDSAENGEKEIKNLIASMNDISRSSKKIEEIIHVIDDIAFQTNLLALNAAVEAARAGEQGKGFAVVAEAVRALAQRSASAAKDINSLIKESVENVGNGTSIADQSGAALNKIVTSVKKVADLNNEISAASGEQTTGILQINKAMNQLDQSAQSNAASSEEIAATSEEISAQANQMQLLVEQLNQLITGKAASSSPGVQESPHAATQPPKVHSKILKFSPPAKSAAAGQKESSKEIIPFGEDEPIRKVGSTDGF